MESFPKWQHFHRSSCVLEILSEKLQVMAVFYNDYIVLCNWNLQFYHVSSASSFDILPFFPPIISAQASLNHQYSTQMSTHQALCVCRSWRRTKIGGLPSPSNRLEHSLTLILSSVGQLVDILVSYLQLCPLALREGMSNCTSSDWM